MQPIGNHPYAKIQTKTDQMGRFWIFFFCSFCGDRSRKHCMNPQRVDQHAFRYATLHAHGLRPR